MRSPSPYRPTSASALQVGVLDVSPGSASHCFVSRRALLLYGVALSTTACETDSVTKPVIPELIPVSQFRPMAFTANVDLRTGRITIIAPTVRGPSTPTLSLDGQDAPTLSLLGGDAVRLVPTNYVALPVGTFAPGKIRVTFDVTIENKLSICLAHVANLAATAGARRDHVSTRLQGPSDSGDTTGGGDSLLVAPPNAGMITPSVEWNGTGEAGSGAPYSFFNDVGCAGVTSDECFRWLAYDADIQPSGRSATHTVGFDIDASVNIFSARMIVAGDLVAIPPPVPSTIVGFVTSTLGGSLAGVRATATSGQSATTSASGSYRIAGLTPGELTVTLSNLPDGCTAPTPQSVKVTAGDSVIADFLVTCAAQTGLLTGTLTSSGDGTPIANATVVASTGGSAVTNASGVYLIPAAGAGSGTLTVSGLVAPCSVSPAPYALQLGGAATVDLVATCTAPQVPPGSQ